MEDASFFPIGEGGITTLAIRVSGQHFLEYFGDAFLQGDLVGSQSDGNQYIFPELKPFAGGGTCHDVITDRFGPLQGTGDGYPVYGTEHPLSKPPPGLIGQILGDRDHSGMNPGTDQGYGKGQHVNEDKAPVLDTS